MKIKIKICKKNKKCCNSIWGLENLNYSTIYNWIIKDGSVIQIITNCWNPPHWHVGVMQDNSRSIWTIKLAYSKFVESKQASQT